MNQVEQSATIEKRSSISRRMLSGVLATVALLGLSSSSEPLVPNLPPGTKIAALGDSYTSGHADGEVDGIYEDCFHHKVSYADQIAEKLGITNFENAACSGASMEEVSTGRFELRPQIDILNEETDYVLLTTGANVANLSELLDVCMNHDCSTDNRDIAAVFEQIRSDEFRERLMGAYLRILSDAPNAALVVSGYPRIIDTSAPCGTIIRDDVDQFVMQFIDTLNAAINQAVAETRQTGGMIFYSKPPNDIDLCRSLGRAFHHDLNNPRAVGHLTEMGHRAVSRSVMATMAAAQYTIESAGQLPTYALAGPEEE